ncbi:FtsB family cell division protein [Pseudoflavonifractor sp. HCP28S3_F10]|uniref:FtsB family cell division protein n=1 Tax=Pseudoflavonifractor sp. HCP28S3_F10 TaxID=3438947 RepID=UPI003F8AA4A2
MRIKRAGFLTKLVVLALLVATASALLNMRTQIAHAQTDKAALTEQRNTQLQVNADLRDAVENSGDPERQAEMARSKLGLAAPGDQVIIFTD